jgi:hypothetical protein
MEKGVKKLKKHSRDVALEEDEQRNLDYQENKLRKVFLD